MRARPQLGGALLPRLRPGLRLGGDGLSRRGVDRGAIPGSRTRRASLGHAGQDRGAGVDPDRDHHAGRVHLRPAGRRDDRRMGRCLCAPGAGHRSCPVPPAGVGDAHSLHAVGCAEHHRRVVPGHAGCPTELDRGGPRGRDHGGDGDLLAGTSSAPRGARRTRRGVATRLRPGPRSVAERSVPTGAARHREDRPGGSRSAAGL